MLDFPAAVVAGGLEIPLSSLVYWFLPHDTATQLSDAQAQELCPGRAWGFACVRACLAMAKVGVEGWVEEPVAPSLSEAEAQALDDRWLLWSHY
jgi:hypothetical protein